jgi:hypothetical protein
VVGLQDSASANLGPILPALCAGLSAAVMLLIADAAAGALAGPIAVVLMVCLPGFIPLHRSSLTGPPLLTITLLMLAAMVHAPRFSLAYGTLGATGGLFVATEGIGLPLAAAAWALLQRVRGRWQRVGLALAPTIIVLVLAHLFGGAWPHDVVYAWRGDLDRAWHAAATIVGDQMAPTITRPALWFVVVAGVVIVTLAVIVVAWRRVARPPAENTAARRVYPVAGLLVAALGIGLAGRALLVHGASEPDLVAVMPLVVLAVLALVVSVATLWASWPRWARAVAVLASLGWIQAAVRGG